MKLYSKIVKFQQDSTVFDFTRNKFNKDDTVINLVDNKIGDIVEVIDFENQSKLEVIGEKLVQETTYYYPIYLVATSEDNLESWRETDIELIDGGK